MSDKEIIKKAEKLINKAKNINLVKSYDEFVDSKEFKEWAINEDDVKYYTSRHEELKSQLEVGDIVFVSQYKYKSGKTGTKHLFVIVSKEKAIELDYFGFLISSNINKIEYPYNEKLYKNEINHLNKDSIVKCDDLIKFNEKQVQFKIGKVQEDEMKRFLNTYENYLNSL